MGLGGYLMWTAVARELHELHGCKVTPVEVNFNGLRLVTSPMFANNPRINQLPDLSNSFPMQLNNPATNYCKQETLSRAIHRYDKHVIEQICEFYQIANPKLKCELFFTDDETNVVERLTQKFNISKEFIVIEPGTKNEYTVNKEYPLHKWQFVVDELRKRGHCVVQVGKDSRLSLKNVINLSSETSFREAALLIGKARTFISSEGGLMHAANAVQTKSVILYTGFIHPSMTCYPENENIWIGASHGPCGMKTACDKCAIDATEHDPTEIVEKTMILLARQ